MVKVSEYFGPTIQGEGKTMGVPAVFLRTSACNLLCGGYGTDKDKQLHDGATWRCDTIEVWKKGNEYTPLALKDKFDEQGLLDRLKDGAHLVITGGEPLLQQKSLTDFLTLLPLSYVEVETNGTIIPAPQFDDFINQYNVSPKLANSGMPRDKRIVKPSLEWHANNPTSYFKFVVLDDKDIQEVNSDFVVPYKIPKGRIYLMPAAETREQLQDRRQQVVELSKQQGYNYSDRLHIQVWDKKTGV